MDTADKKVDMSQFKVTSKQDIDNYLMESAFSFSVKDSETGAKSMLKRLLTGTSDENDDFNANTIARLTNMIEGLQNKINYRRRSILIKFSDIITLWDLFKFYSVS